MDDTISKQDAIDAVHKEYDTILDFKSDGRTVASSFEDVINALPPAQPKISRIEQELHGKTPEEQYEFLYWLLLKFGLSYTDSRLAVVEWLRGERNE